MNLRERILGLKKFENKKVFVPEWNEHVWLKRCSAEELVKFANKTQKELMAEVVLDEMGDPIFENGDELYSCDAVACKRLSDEFTKFTEVSKHIEREDVDEVKKKSKQMEHSS